MAGLSVCLSVCLSLCVGRVILIPCHLAFRAAGSKCRRLGGVPGRGVPWLGQPSSSMPMSRPDGRSPKGPPLAAALFISFGQKECCAPDSPVQELCPTLSVGWRYNFSSVVWPNGNLGFATGSICEWAMLTLTRSPRSPGTITGIHSNKVFVFCYSQAGSLRSATRRRGKPRSQGFWN